MVVPEATRNTIRLKPLTRSRYDFTSLARSVLRNETAESFVGLNILDSAGFCLEPFWNTPGDTEGLCYASYIAKHPLFDLSVREGVFERLCAAGACLPKEWKLVLKAGFRPYEVQVEVLHSFINESRARHFDWSDEQHIAQARMFVADPTVVCPPHVTGGAVDVDVRDRKTDEYIDMGCPPNTDSEISFLHNDALTAAQYKNRMTLLNAMLSAGFAPNPHEWWHYQYGETYWAAFYGHESTLYDLITV